MPISSGALEWPVSYYSKREKDAMELQAAGTDGGLTPRGSGGGNTPRGTAPVGYEWQPQLTNRGDYEKWRKKMDKKDPLKTKSRKRHGCFGCLQSNKINKENEDPTKGEQRDDPREVIRRHRRRRCCLLALVMSLLAFLLMVIFVFVFLRFTGNEVIGPDVATCSGQWRSHYLAYQEILPNGTSVYYCCYLPDIKNQTLMQAVLAQEVWPDGYLVNKADCPPPGTNKCKDYTEKQFLALSVPYVPCRASSLLLGGGGGGGAFAKVRLAMSLATLALAVVVWV